MSIGNLVPIGGTIIGGAAGLGIMGASVYGADKFVEKFASNKNADHVRTKASLAGIAATALGITTFAAGSAIQTSLTAPRAANGMVKVWYSMHDLKPMANGAKAGVQMLKTAGGIAGAAGLILALGATVAMESSDRR